MPEPSTALGALLSGSPEVANTAAVAAAAKGLLGSCAAGLLAAKAPAAGGEDCASARLHTTAGMSYNAYQSHRFEEDTKTYMMVSE
jgi:hypothetical protein